MIIVTNRIQVKKGMAAAMAPRFTAPGALDTFQGFRKVEVWLTQNLEDHDELNVHMYWDSQEDFAAWRNSDAFKAAHQRPEPGSHGGQESPILGSEITTYEVASVREAAK
ncbi:heme oxygenase [Gorillibacterium sp. sgz500922]|uniref:heme oxygenase n=1 Tax=Gorillibacterium sp. sgz500922 TaxID=3446694 RepID=UPI003F67062B